MIRIFCLSIFMCRIAFAQDIAKADAYFTKADSLRKVGERDSAIVYFGKAATAFVSLLQYEKQVACLNQIGIILTRQDKYEKAQQILDSALVIGLKHLGNKNKEVATTYLSMGVIYNAEEKYELSLHTHQQALNIRLALFGEYNADVATSYGNMGNVSINARDLKNAITYHSNALRIRKKVFGSQGIELVESYNGLGNAYREKGEYKKSISNFEKALHIRKTRLGEKHKDLAKTYKDISQVYYLMKNQEQGDFYKKMADEITSAQK